MKKLLGCGLIVVVAAFILLAKFTFQGGKETLTQGVVEAVADRSGGRPHPGLLASLPDGRGGKEVPLHQIRDHLGLLAADGRSGSFAAADALRSCCPHQASHSLPTYPKPLPGQLKMDPRHPAGLAGTVVNCQDPLHKRRIGRRPLRERTILPRMISGRPTDDTSWRLDNIPDSPSRVRRCLGDRTGLQGEPGRCL